ncbi:hypothetical protein [uncultured Gammaproteobacteria bacterium]|jgi:hypothetical protein|nr:hypothetical protein [uncultured Gammaproteobacteria bacterium]CAC9442882.1 hypothetical protein [uncultured Gammaproteobacteria bacterium]
MENAADEGVNQFGEEPKSKSGNKKVFIKVISVFVVIVMISAIFFFTQQQDGVVVARYQDVLGSNLQKPKNNNSKTKGVSVKIKSLPLVIKQNDQSKFEEEIKKILKKALISAHENSKNEVNELIKKNEQFLDEFKNSIIQNQENNNHKILLKVNKVQETIFSKIGSLLDSRKQKIKESTSANEVFELIGISLWDSKPQATIRYQGKTSVVDVGNIRIGWKIVGIDFDKEQITILKNGQKYTLEKIK